MPDTLPAAREDFMRLALDQAQLAWDRGEVPVGAVVVKDGEVIAVGSKRLGFPNGYCTYCCSSSRQGHRSRR